MMDNKPSLEKISSTVISIGFVMLLIGMFVLCAITPDKEKSEMENRELQGLPKFKISKVIDGSYMKSFEVYAADNVVSRNSWVSMKNRIDICSGKKDNGITYFGKEGYLFSQETLSEEQFEKNLAYTKAFVDTIEMQHNEMKVSVLIAPTASEVLQKKLPKYATMPDQQRFLSKVSDAFGERFIDVTKKLREHDEEYVYYKTDHHWTSLGAYYAYAAWAEHRNIAALSKDLFDIEPVSEEFYGTTYAKAVGANSAPDTIEKFSNQFTEASVMTVERSKGEKNTGGIFDDTYLETGNKYSYFLSDNNPLSIIETPVKNQKNLLVIKDSYANSFVPFLTAHFERIYVIDLRYYKESVTELIEKKQISEVLILYNVVQYSNDRNLIYLSVEK